MALGAPGDGSATEEENVSDGAPQRVRAICVCGVVVPVDGILDLGHGQRAEVVLEPIVARAGEIAQQALERNNVCLAWIVHTAAQDIHTLDYINARPT